MQKKTKEAITIYLETKVTNPDAYVVSHETNSTGQTYTMTVEKFIKNASLVVEPNMAESEN